jgi:hypothetical protein
MNIEQVIIFTQRPEFKMLLEIECKGLTGHTLLIYQNLEDFKSMLTLLDQVEILVVDSPDEQKLFQDILFEVKQKRTQIKSCFFLTDEAINLDNTEVYAKNDLEKLLIKLKQIINPPADLTGGYISVSIDSLVHFKVLPFDLFIKIGEDKYFKRIPAHEELDQHTFASFFQKGVTTLFYEKKFNRDFSMMLINHMINKVEKDYAGIDEKLLATNHVFQTTQQIVAKLGFKPKLIQVCESVMNQILGDVTSGQDNFTKFLEQLRLQRELSFNYRLMELTSFIGTQMIEATENNGLEEKIRRLVFASMFCDYALGDPYQVHIRRTDQLHNLTTAEQKRVNEHALRGSELILNYINAPIEASSLIKQHHGSITGIGFPSEISPKLLPLSKCLMAAQELAFDILVQHEKDPAVVLKEVRQKWVDTPLEDYIEKFQKCCLIR